MSEYMSGWELLEYWGLKNFELFQIVKKGDIRPYNQFGQLKPYAGYISQNERERVINSLKYYQESYQDIDKRLTESGYDLHSFPLKKPTLSSFADRLLASSHLSTIQKLKIQINEFKNMPLDPYDWSKVKIPYAKDEATMFLDDICESLYHKNDIKRVNDRVPKPDNSKTPVESKSKPKPKLRTSQRHRLASRKVVAGIWEIHPETTIADMIIRDEIVHACEGKIYAERTIRNWIKDLCPNRSPGRRPKMVDPN